MSQGYTLMERIGKGAGHAPRSVDMQKSQTKQLLFLYVKFFLRDNAHVKQFLEFFEFISSGGLLNYSGAFWAFQGLQYIIKIRDNAIDNISLRLTYSYIIAKRIDY